MCKEACLLLMVGSYLFFFLRFFFFWGGPLLKSLLNLLQYCLLYVLGFWPRSSPTRDRTHNPCTGRWSRKQWTSREVPGRAALFSGHGLHSLHCDTHLIKVTVESNPLRKCFRDFLGNILLLCDLLHQIIYFVQIPGKQCFVEIL